MRSVYLDSNVFIYPLIYEDSGKAVRAKRALKMIEMGEIVAYTSTLSWDEVAWVVRRVLGQADSLQAGDKLISFPKLRFIPFSEELMVRAQRLVEQYKLAPRDAIHCAAALSKQVEAILSDDEDLDVVKEIKREGLGKPPQTKV